MIKREFKINLKSFIIWTSILLIMFLVVFLVYPYIITDDTIKNLDEMMKVFPKELLTAFNMDITSINTAYGWLKSEGFMFVLLVIGIYASMLGSNIVLREENDKTIEYLNSLPIKRKKILNNKIIVSIVYIVGITLILGIFNYVCLLLSGDFNQKEYILLSITPIFIGLPLFGINLLISMFLHRTKKTTGISLGLIFLFYMLNVLSELSKNVEFLKYFSVYTLADIRNIVKTHTLNYICIIVSLLITLLTIYISHKKYDKKELV